MNSLRLAGKRYLPGDEVELTQEQANRLNMDLFASAAPCGKAEEAEAASKLAAVVPAPQAAVEKPKKSKHAGPLGKQKE